MQTKNKTKKPELSKLMDKNFYDMINGLASRQMSRCQYKSPLISKDELVSEAILATVQAYEAYDPDGGATFRSYAYTYIVYALKRFCQKNRFKFSATISELSNNTKELYEVSSGMMNIEDIDIPHEPVQESGLDLDSYLLDGLNEENKSLVIDRYLKKFTFEELSDKYGMTGAGIAKRLEKLNFSLEERAKRYECED